MQGEYSTVTWGKPTDQIYNYWKVPYGMLENFLIILELNGVDLRKVSVQFYAP